VPAAIACAVLLIAFLAGCKSGGPYIESTGLGRELGYPGRPDFNDYQPILDVAFEGAAPVSSWDRVGLAYLYNSKVRSGAYIASSNH